VAESVRGRERLDLVLRVIDHQVIGPDGALLGNVDDIELAGRGSELTVAGLAIGAEALSHQLPGRLGAWADAIRKRLSTRTDPTAFVLPIEHVTEIGAAIAVDDAAAEALLRAQGFEAWLREHVISRIPGAKGGDDPERRLKPDQADGGSSQDRGLRSEGAGPPGSSNPPMRPPGESGTWLSSLHRRPVVDESGKDLGKVLELRCSTRSSPWRITHLEVTRTVMGAELGYNVDPVQGPAFVGRLFRHLHRHDLLIPIDHVVTFNQDPVEIVVTSRDDRVHPHAALQPGHEPWNEDPS